MSETSASTPSIPVPKRLSTNWSDLFKFIAYLLPAIGVIVMIYLRSEFVTKTEFNALQAEIRATEAANQMELKHSIDSLSFAVNSIVPRVTSLEEYKTDSKQTNKDTSVTIGVIQQDISSIKASQMEARINTSRILQKLDTLPTK